VWAGRTVALLHCRTACTAEPANVRTFPSLSARSLDMCAHFLPRHLAKAGPFVRTFGRVRKVRTFFGCVRGDLQHPAKCAHKSRDGRLRGREMCAHSPWFSGATVQQCDGATRKRPWRTEQRSAGCEPLRASCNASARCAAKAAKGFHIRTRLAIGLIHGGAELLDDICRLPGLCSAEPPRGPA
jgi:hypothetical protein